MEDPINARWPIYSRDKIIKDIKNIRESKKSIYLYVLDLVAVSSADDFYSVVENEFKLPSYFGKNLNALLDCLRDGDVIPNGPIIIFVLGFDTTSILTENIYSALIDLFDAAGRYWRSPDWPWNNLSRPFHAIFQSNLKSIALEQLPIAPM